LSLGMIFSLAIRWSSVSIESVSWLRYTAFWIAYKYFNNYLPVTCAAHPVLFYSNWRLKGTSPWKSYEIITLNDRFITK
jgi:hypothetical protein